MRHVATTLGTIAATAMLALAVLLLMVGNTVHVLQTVG